MFVRLLRDGLVCFDLFMPVHSHDEGSTPTSVAAASKDEKEIIDMFATVFTLVDSATFQACLCFYSSFK